MNSLPFRPGDLVVPTEAAQIKFGNALRPGKVIDCYILRGWTTPFVSVEVQPGPCQIVSGGRAEHYRLAGPGEAVARTPAPLNNRIKSDSRAGIPVTPLQAFLVDTATDRAITRGLVEAIVSQNPAEEA